METKPTQLKASEAADLSDGTHIFQVPLRHAAAILKAVPELRHDFSDIGGRFISHGKQKD